MQWISKLLTFIKSALSERDGTGSTSRVLGALTVVATLSWVSYLVVTTHTLPDLTSPSLFIASGFSGYGANKLAGAIGGKRDDQLAHTNEQQ